MQGSLASPRPRWRDRRGDGRRPPANGFANGSRSPGRKVLGDHEARQDEKVRRDRLGLHAAVRTVDVVAQRVDRSGCGHVASQRTQQPRDGLGVATNAVDPLDVCVCDLVDVATDQSLGLFDGSAEVVGPAADRGELGYPLDGVAGIARLDRCALKERAKRDRICRVTSLGKSHRPHADAAEPTSTGVTRRVIGGYGGPGQDELAARPTIVDS